MSALFALGNNSFFMKFLVFFLWLIHWLPLPVIGRLGKVLGLVTYYFLHERRQITLVNLHFCFPEMNEKERIRLAKEHFMSYGRSILERSILWWASRERIERLIEVVPSFPIDEVKKGPVIFLCPHFVCLEIPGVIVTLNTVGSSIYTEQRNKTFDRLLRHGRMRFNSDVLLFSRGQGIKPILRALKQNIPFYMLPDMDFGLQDAAFVPFFGQMASTLLAPARISAATGAIVIPVIASFLPNYKGWRVEFWPPLEDFPGDDMIAATQRINTFIEQRVLEYPAEYWWMHRRFKTRPPGMPDIYGI
jgi:KDO2-lipid IV(A) lauroyltransferase